MRWENCFASRHPFRRVAATLVGAVGCLLAVPAQAAILLTNTGATPAGSASFGLLRGSQIVVPAGTAYTIDRLTIRAFAVSSATVAFSVYDDVGGFPGTQTASLGSVAVSAAALYDFVPAQPIYLAPGSTSWLVGGQTSGTAAWSATASSYSSSGGVTSPHQAFFSGGVWGSDDGFGYNMFELEATAAATTTVTGIARTGATPTNASSVDWTVTFADAVDGLAAANFSLATSGVTGAAVTGAVPTGAAPATTWTVTASTGSGDGTLGLDLTSTNGLDRFVSNLAFAGEVYAIDKTAPTVAIEQAGAQPDPTNASPIVFDVLFSESVSGFGPGDVDLSASTAGGTLVAAVSGSGAAYTVQVSGMTSEGVVVASIPAGGASDAAGNLNAISTSVDPSVTWDATAPTVAIEQAGAQPDPTNASPIVFDVFFSESVSGFGPGDVDLSASTAGGALVAAVGGSGAAYTVQVSGMTSDGVVVASIPAGGASDATGNLNALSTSVDSSVAWDGTAPTVTLEQAVGQPDPAHFGPIVFDVQFSEPVSDFDASDVDLGASTVSGSLDAIVVGSGSTYGVEVSGMTSPGVVVLSIPAAAAHDGVGNASEASTSADNSVEYQPLLAVAIPTLGGASLVALGLALALAALALLRRRPIAVRSRR